MSNAKADTRSEHKRTNGAVIFRTLSKDHETDLLRTYTILYNIEEPPIELNFSKKLSVNRVIHLLKLFIEDLRHEGFETSALWQLKLSQPKKRASINYRKVFQCPSVSRSHCRGNEDGSEGPSSSNTFAIAPPPVENLRRIRRHRTAWRESSAPPARAILPRQWASELMLEAIRAKTSSGLKQQTGTQRRGAEGDQR